MSLELCISTSTESKGNDLTYPTLEDLQDSLKIKDFC